MFIIVVSREGEGAEGEVMRSIGICSTTHQYIFVCACLALLQEVDRCWNKVEVVCNAQSNQDADTPATVAKSEPMCFVAQDFSCTTSTWSTSSAVLVAAICERLRKVG